MAAHTPQTVSTSAVPKNRVLAFSSEQEAVVTEHSTVAEPEDLATSLQLRGMESWLALINASTWLDLAEEQQGEVKVEEEADSPV